MKKYQHYEFHRGDHRVKVGMTSFVIITTLAQIITYFYILAMAQACGQDIITFNLD